MIKFKFTEKDTEYYKNWLSFYPKRDKGTGFNLTFEKWGYFDPRPQINTNVTTLVVLFLPFVSLWLVPISILLCFYSWGSIYLKLPYNTSKDECSDGNIAYGLTFYHPDSGFPTEAWVRGWKSFNFPWAWKFDKREVLHKNGWRKEERGDDFWDKEKWKNEIILEKFPYKYALKSGEVQERIATVYQERRYWKNWFGVGKKKVQFLEIEFSDEVGERTGSWKGGCIGCGYEMKKGEKTVDTLKRMEKERKF